MWTRSRTTTILGIVSTLFYKDCPAGKRENLQALVNPVSEV